MTEKQRLQRICELLAKACMLDWASAEAGESPALSSYESPRKANKPAREPTDEERIITYLQRGPASPKELSSLLRLSRRTLNRRISKLIFAGVVVRKGRTKRTEYDLKYHLLT